MFSKRAGQEQPPNRLSETLARIRRSPEPWIDLTLANPTQAGLSYPKELLTDLSNPAALQYQPEALGVDRSPMVALWQRRGYQVSPEQIVLTASTSEAYAILFKLLCDPGDEVLVPRPSYPLLDHLTTLESVNLSNYRLSYDGSWSIDWVSVEAALSEKTRAICIVNPNNPTGSYLKQDELQRLLALGLPVISDEVFGDYPLRTDERRVRSVVGMQTGLFFSLDGLSKSVGLPQMKLAWITVAGEAEKVAAATERLGFLLDTYLSVSTPIQLAAPQLLLLGRTVQQGIQARILENHEWLGQRLQGSLVSPLFTEGGWCAALRLPKWMTDEAWALAILMEARTLTQPGYFYDFEEEALLVVSLLTPPDSFRSGIEQMLGVVTRRS